MFMFFFFLCRFDVHVLLFWVCFLILGLMSLLSLFLAFKKNIEEKVLIFLPKKNNESKNDDDNNNNNNNNNKLDLKLVSKNFF